MTHLIRGPTQVKEWLAACLWKTMKDNKKYYKIFNVDKDSIKFIPYLETKYGILRFKRHREENQEAGKR